MTPRPKQEENKNWIVRLFKAMNDSWASRIFTIVVILLLGSGYLLYSFNPITKTRTQTNTFCEEQVKILTNALIDIKKDVNKALPQNPSTFHLMGGIESLAISFPYIDTLRKKKRVVEKKVSPPQQQQQVQIALKNISNKIDSILRSVQQQQKPKN